MTEDLKNSFIVDENPDDKKIEEYIKRTMTFCKVSKTGSIIFTNENLKTLDKIKSTLVARYLANRLENSISSEITADEFAKILDIPKTQVFARLKDARDERFATVSKTGGYKINSYEISKFLDKLEEKYGNV